jgi:hypothetical protein
LALTFTACADKKPDESKTAPPPQDQAAKPEATPQQTPPTTYGPAPAPATQSKSEPSKTEAAERPKQQPSSAPAAERPAIVPIAPKPEATRPSEAKPAPPQSEATKPGQSEPAKTAPPSPPSPPAAPRPPLPEQNNAKPRDVALLTGNPMGPVRFEHKLHVARAGNNCATCHHPSRPQKPAAAPQQACSDCHTKVATPPMKTKYQAAFHAPTAMSGTCIDCHKTENAKGKKAPLKCVECHKKEDG